MSNHKPYSEWSNDELLTGLEDKTSMDTMLNLEAATRFRRFSTPKVDAALIKEFVQRIGVAQWKLDLDAFCELAGFLPDDYGKAKFRQFAELNKALSHFDTETLCKILGVDQ